MYNRYVPQPDGSYLRNRMQESHRNPEHSTQPAPIVPAPDCSIGTQECCSSCPTRNLQRKNTHHRQKAPVQNVGVMNFLKQLLPKEFDAEDLLIVLLLLLMTGDNREDQSTALLTLVLYLFL